MGLGCGTALVWILKWAAEVQNAHRDDGKTGVECMCVCVCLRVCVYFECMSVGGRVKMG